MCAVAWLLSGCSGAAPPVVEAGSRESAPVEAARDARAGVAARPSEEAGVERQERGARESDVAILPQRLVLPRDEVFLKAPLPAQRPERYGSFREVSRVHVGKSHLQQVDLFPGEASLLALSDEEATVRIYDRRAKRLLGNHGITGFRRFETGGVLAWPEGAPRFLAATPAGLLLLDALTGGVLERLDERPLGALRWAPDRRILAASARGPQGVLHVFERGREGARLRPLGSLHFSGRIDAWDLSADNRLLALSTYPEEELRVVDLHTGGDVLRVPGPRYAGDVAFSPDGRFVAMGGAGLLLVDLINPERRAFYSYFYNNVGHVRFSPSGDALAASSYDGHVRIFRYERVPRGSSSGLELTLLRALRHEGRANVYAFTFEAGGDGLVSASGDQTLRTFRANGGGAASPEGAARVFHTLSDWKRVDPEDAQRLPAPPEPSLAAGRYVPARLERAPHSSRIQPGRYACKIDLMYKLRDCWVRKDDAGHTLLRFAPDNLLGLEGVLYDDGSVVRFEGWLTEPSTIVGCRGCERQPLHAIFRGGGRSWKGLLQFRNYYDPHAPPAPPAPDASFETANDRFPLVLELREASGAER